MLEERESLLADRRSGRVITQHLTSAINVYRIRGPSVSRRLPAYGSRVWLANDALHEHAPSPKWRHNHLCGRNGPRSANALPAIATERISGGAGALFGRAPDHRESTRQCGPERERVVSNRSTLPARFE